VPPATLTRPPPCPPPCSAPTAPRPTPSQALRGSGVALLAAALFAGGCASLQQPAVVAPAAPPPAAWHAPLPPVAAEPAELARWWTRLGDPALPGLVEQALVANTQIAAAEARLLQARAAREAAAAALRPRLALDAGSQWRWEEATGTTRETHRIGLEAAWEADLWGRGGAAERAAAAAAQAGGLDLDQVRVVVAAEVALALLQWRGAQARAALARRHLALLEQTLQIARWRAEAGLATQLEVEQARNAAERLRAQLPVLASSAAQALNALGTLTARPVAALHAELAGAADADALRPLAAAPVPAVPAEVLRRRPDVTAAERRLVAAGARVEQADLQRLPALTLTGTLGLQALGLAALGSGAGVATLAAGLSAPLADGDRLQAQVRQHEGARAEAAAAYRAAVLGALQEVEDALVAIAHTGQQLAALHAAADAARAAAALAEQRWRAGLVDFQHVLLAQRSLVEAEDSVAATTVALAGAQVRLFRALGGGWSPPYAGDLGGWPPPSDLDRGGWAPAQGEPGATVDAPTPATAAARPAYAVPAPTRR
jgi:NodT family efflux transporter outer membrane factor (OMF) lipoprotein